MTSHPISRAAAGAVFAALLACPLAGLVASDAAAQPLRPGVIGEDDRRLVTDDNPLWDAIGHVNIGGHRTRSSCTGTLVAPRLVVTAAHCLVNPRTGAPYPLRDTHFVAAPDAGAHKGHRTAACLRFPENAPFLGDAPAPSRRSMTADDAARDIAVIVLKDALDLAPAPLAAPSAQGAPRPLTHAAYFGDRRQKLSAHRGCRLKGVDPTRSLWITDCDAHFASSGGPVFAEDADGALELAAVMVAIAPHQSASLAVPLSAWRELLDEARCQKAH